MEAEAVQPPLNRRKSTQKIYKIKFLYIYATYMYTRCRETLLEEFAVLFLHDPSSDEPPLQKVNEEFGHGIVERFQLQALLNELHPTGGVVAHGAKSDGLPNNHQPLTSTSYRCIKQLPVTENTSSQGVKQQRLHLQCTGTCVLRSHSNGQIHVVP